MEKQGASYTTIDLTTDVPTKTELRSAIKQHGVKKVFNTSGQKYRELQLKDKIEKMSTTEAVDLLSSDGMLIKRPFIVEGASVSLGKKS